MALRALAYVRVSTEEQAASGAGLAAQRTQIAAMVEARGWQLLSWHVDAGLSARDLARPSLQAALERLQRREAEVLVVAKLDRLTRSVGDFAAILERATRERWQLVALDVGVDTSTPSGELVANVIAAVAQWERRVISQRTREGLAAQRAAGWPNGRPGPDPLVTAEVEARIVMLRKRGRSLRGICRLLDAADIRTPSGGHWSPSTLRRVLARHADSDGIPTGRRRLPAT